MNVAIVGLGFMGATHVKAWKQTPGVNIAAVVSSDEKKRAGDLSSVEGNLGGSGEHFDFSQTRKYKSLEEALRDPGVDAVDICLPTNLHVAAAEAALSAGKHVLLEKPMALDFPGAEQLRLSAHRSGRVFMVAHVLRFIPAYRSITEWLKTAGQVHSALFRRRCAAPAWSGWLGDKTRSGGGVFDLLIHDVDFCLSLWGMPASVRATGYENLSAGIDLLHAELQYPGRPPIIVTGGWHPPQSYPFSMDYSIVAERDTKEWSSLNAADVTDPFAAELSYFAECVHCNRQPVLCPPEQSAQAVALLRFMLESREHNGETIRTA